MKHPRVKGGKSRPELRKAREVMRGILRCPLCDRSGGSIREGNEVCEKCRALLAPTPLEAVRAALGITVAELAELAGVTSMTIHRALRGEPVNRETAEAISRTTGLDAGELRAGTPSPFRRRE